MSIKPPINLTRSVGLAIALAIAVWTVAMAPLPLPAQESSRGAEQVAPPRPPQEALPPPQEQDDSDPFPPIVQSDELLPVPMGRPLSPSNPAIPSTFVAPQEPLELVDFREETLDQALRVFAEQSGLNIVASSDARERTVNLYLRNVLPMDVLENLTQTHDLYYRIDEGSGIIRIYTTEEYERNLASFRDERTEVFTLLYPNPVDVAVAIRDLFGERVRLNFGVGDQDSILDIAYRLNRFDLIDGRSLGLGQLGQYRFGGSNITNIYGLGGFSYDPNRQFGVNPDLGQEYLPLSDLNAERIQQLEEALQQKRNFDDEAAIRQGAEENGPIAELLKERQATIFVTVVRRNNQVIVRTGDENTMKQIEDLIHRLDVPTPLVLLEVKVMSVILDDKFTSVFDYEYSDGGTSAGSFTTGDILPTPSDLVNGQARRFLSMLPGGSVLNQGDLTFQVISNSFRARMQLLEDDNRVTVLNSPLLLTANNEVSRIFIGETVPFTIGFTPPTVINSNGTTTVAGAPITELRDVGQSLLITPSINADRTVTVRVVQENARREIAGGTIPVQDVNGIRNQDVDTVNRSTVSGTVIAKDGCAVALGGLIEEEISDRREQVPVIGKLPVLGFFFRRQETGRTRRELVVMIRPFIFNTPAESAALSQDLLSELSVHPTAQTGQGSLYTFSPDEVVTVDLDECDLHRTFRFHNVTPKRY